MNTNETQDSKKQSRFFTVLQQYVSNQINLNSDETHYPEMYVKVISILPFTIWDGLHSIEITTNLDEIKNIKYIMKQRNENTDMEGTVLLMKEWKYQTNLLQWTNTLDFQLIIDKLQYIGNSNKVMEGPFENIIHYQPAIDLLELLRRHYIRQNLKSRKRKGALLQTQQLFNKIKRKQIYRKVLKQLNPDYIYHDQDEQNQNSTQNQEYILQMIINILQQKRVNQDDLNHNENQEVLTNLIKEQLQNNYDYNQLIINFSQDSEIMANKEDLIQKENDRENQVIHQMLDEIKEKQLLTDKSDLPLDRQPEASPPKIQQIKFFKSTTLTTKKPQSKMAQKSGQKQQYLGKQQKQQYIGKQSKQQQYQLQDKQIKNKKFKSNDNYSKNVIIIVDDDNQTNQRKHKQPIILSQQKDKDLIIRPYGPEPPPRQELLERIKEVKGQKIYRTNNRNRPRQREYIIIDENDDRPNYRRVQKYQPMPLRDKYSSTRRTNKENQHSLFQQRNPKPRTRKLTEINPDTQKNRTNSYSQNELANFKNLIEQPNEYQENQEQLQNMFANEYEQPFEMNQQDIFPPFEENNNNQIWDQDELAMGSLDQQIEGFHNIRKTPSQVYSVSDDMEYMTQQDHLRDKYPSQSNKISSQQQDIILNDDKNHSKSQISKYHGQDSVLNQTPSIKQSTINRNTLILSPLGEENTTYNLDIGQSYPVQQDEICEQEIISNKQEKPTEQNQENKQFLVLSPQSTPKKNEEEQFSKHTLELFRKLYGGAQA